jgi:hypothetical protein
MAEIGEYKMETNGGAVVINAHNSTDSIFRTKRQASGCEGECIGSYHIIHPKWVHTIYMLLRGTCVKLYRCVLVA